MRGAEHPLERPVVLRLLQQREDAAAVVVGHDQDQVGPRLPRADEQARGIVQEREVTHQGSGGTAARALVSQRRTGRRGDHAVDPARAPAGQHGQPGPRCHLLVQVADGQAGRRPQQCAVRQGRRQVPGEPRLGEGLAVGEEGRGRGRGRRVGRAPGRQPVRAGAGAGPPGQPYRRHHVGGTAHRVGPVPRALRDDHVAGRRTRFQVAELSAGQPGPPGGHDDVRPVRRQEPGRFEQVLVGGQAHRPGPRARRGLGEHRPASLLRQVQQRRGVGAAVTADDHPALGPRQVQRARRRCGRESCPGSATGAAVQRLRPAAAPTVGRVRHAGHQGLTQRQVEVDRPGEPAADAPGGRPGPAGQRPPVGVHPRPRLRHPGLAEPAHRIPVQLDLVDGLVRTGAAQLRRPVRGEHQQWHPCLAGLDHGPVEVRRRGPRGAHQRDRTPGSPWPGRARETRRTARRSAHAAASPSPALRGPRAPWPAVRCGIPVRAPLRPART